ncbi:hypothetical protein [Mesorhizobium sp. M0959]
MRFPARSFSNISRVCPSTRLHHGWL